ncbi:lytic transglycosylase domain-containing protein [Lacrimispora sp. JR3]|uniref:lytic transglycosylase domain-containing protein n=1 Tax=Lacrimispora sinapis TaxID=3111456 RepID=UPI003747B7E7
MATIEQLRLSAIARANTRRTENTGSVSGGDFKQVLKSITNIPANLDAMFTEAANKYGIPEKLLKAVAKVESNFNPSATSQKGAAGVMQLMPATAKSLGVANPYDARSNIMGGAKYLKENLERYNGNVELTLAAYNAGSNNVKKYGGIPPFKETQQYVKKVMNYMGGSDETKESSFYFSKSSKNTNNYIQTHASNYNGYDPQSTNEITDFMQALSSMTKQSDGTGENSLLTNKTNYLYLIELMKLRMQMSSYSIANQHNESDSMTGSLYNI